MKKILYLLILPILLNNSSFAIDWIDVKNEKGISIAVDKDSINEIDNYYFYNTRFQLKSGQDVVVTMQSQKNTPLCTRIKQYSLPEYEKLSGDYENITNGRTKDLEYVTFESRAYLAHKKVKELMLEKHLPNITF